MSLIVLVETGMTNPAEDHTLLCEPFLCFGSSLHAQAMKTPTMCS